MRFARRTLIKNMVGAVAVAWLEVLPLPVVRPKVWAVPVGWRTVDPWDGGELGPETWVTSWDSSYPIMECRIYRRLGDFA